MTVEPVTHCRRGHEFTPENTYVVPGHPNKRVCRACRQITQSRYMRERPITATREEPNTVDIDGVTFVISTEHSESDPIRTPTYHVTTQGGQPVGVVYQLNLIIDTTWFACRPGEPPTGPYPDTVSALRGLRTATTQEKP